jgi:hypothetical protein
VVGGAVAAGGNVFGWVEKKVAVTGAGGVVRVVVVALLLVVGVLTAALRAVVLVKGRVVVVVEDAGLEDVVVLETAGVAEGTL